MRIDVEGLAVRYGEATAIDGLTFSLEPGKIYGLLGRNGSGKTSLLSVLAAFRKPSAGSVRVDGHDVFEDARLTSRISLIRDTGETVDVGTAEDALYFAEWLRPGWDGDYARSLMETFGLTPKMNVGTMSKGQRSAMGVVVGLAGRAPLTIFDESYLGMDAPSRTAFYDALLSDYMAHPRTIIMSTHLVEEVGSLFEEIMIIDKGRLVVHEETGVLLARGASVTGPAEQVDAVTTGLTVLGVKRLGATASAMVYGDPGDAWRGKAEDAGLELQPVALQDLFIHLTGGDR